MLVTPLSLQQQVLTKAKLLTTLTNSELTNLVYESLAVLDGEQSLVHPV